MARRPTKAAKNKGGRPPALMPDEKTLKVVRGLGQIQATSKEIAAVLGVSEPTWIAFKAKHPEVADALQQGTGTGLASLRRRQFKAADAGNATMLVWLGKQYLGQRDHRDISGPGGGPIPTVDLTKLSGDDLARLEAIFGPLAGSGDDDAPDQGGEGEAGG